MVQWLKMQVLGMEVPALVQTLVRLYSTFFVHLFYPVVTALLEYLDPTILRFLLYNFVAVTLFLFRLSKGTATMISIPAH